MLWGVGVVGRGEWRAGTGRRRNDIAERASAVGRYVTPIAGPRNSLHVSEVVEIRRGVAITADESRDEGGRVSALSA